MNGTPQALDTFVGTPRPLPRALFCAAKTDWCGWVKMANTDVDYDRLTKLRRAHETLCGGAEWAKDFRIPS